MRMIIGKKTVEPPFIYTDACKKDKSYEKRGMYVKIYLTHIMAHHKILKKENILIMTCTYR